MPLVTKNAPLGTASTFEESLHQHLSMLQTVLLQEHQKFVAQFADSQESMAFHVNPEAEVFAVNPDIQPSQNPEPCSSIGVVRARREPLELSSAPVGLSSAPVGRVPVLKSKKKPSPSAPMPPSPLMARITAHHAHVTKKTANIFGVYDATAAERFADLVEQESEELKWGWPDHMGGRFKRPMQFLASDICVELFFDFVVVSNVVLMGFQTGSSWHGWFVVDCVYAALFILELMLRLGIRSFSSFSVFKLSSPELKWMLFDIVLVCISIFDIIASALDATSGSENTNYTWLRIARLVRIARILRLLKLDFLKDLVLVIDGAVGGLHTLAWSMLIIVLPLYVFALFFTVMIGSQEPDDNDVVQHFSNVGVSMFTGFRCLVEGDCSTMSGTPIFPLMVSEYGWIYGVVYSMMSIFMSFGLFNVIIAIYVENTVNAAKSNEVLQRQRRLEDESRFAEKLLHLIHFLWKYHDQENEGMVFDLDQALQMQIDGVKFSNLVERPAMRDLLGELDVPKEDHKDLFEICDADGSGLVSMAELVAGVRRLRGDPRRSDLVYVMLRINRLLAEQHGIYSDTNSPDGVVTSPACQRKFPLYRQFTPRGSQSMSRLARQITPGSQRMSPVSWGAPIHHRPKQCPISTVSEEAKSPVAVSSSGAPLEFL